MGFFRKAIGAARCSLLAVRYSQIKHTIKDGFLFGEY
jgi:hypothetical protein